MVEISGAVIVWLVAMWVNYRFIIQGEAYDGETGKHAVLGWMIMLLLAGMSSVLQSELGYIGFVFGFIVMVFSVTQLLAEMYKD